jgi:hypothetical protein
MIRKTNGEKKKCESEGQPAMGRYPQEKMKKKKECIFL